MLCRLIKSILVTILVFALQTGGGANVYASVNKQQADKTQGAGVKQSTQRNQLIAEGSAEVNLPALQISLNPAAFFYADALAKPLAGLNLYKGVPSTVPESRFYRLILFPFHGFW